jgi:hypothetical protein
MSVPVEALTASDGVISASAGLARKVARMVGPT